MYKTKKRKAQWTGGFKKVIRQYIKSLKSYLIYPFVKKKPSATKEFFSAIYSRESFDDLIFDGGMLPYYDKMIDLSLKKSYKQIVDCGCGQGAIRDFFQKNGIKYGKYIGIDFAISEKELKADEAFVPCDLAEYKFDLTEDDLVVFCNTACYLSDDVFSSIIRKIAEQRASILIIDPLPSLFWDATFDHVKLFYRSIDKMKKMMQDMNYYSDMISKDYLIKIGKLFIRSLSYAALFEGKRLKQRG